jgi:hypothetical protein
VAGWELKVERQSPAQAGACAGFVLAGKQSGKFQTRQDSKLHPPRTSNPEGIESFSPVLADEIGLHRVIGMEKTTLKGLGQSHT